MDNIDVSECINFNSKNGKCRIPHFCGCVKYTSCNCDDISDCYYKQLQRVKLLQEKVNTIIRNNKSSIECFMTQDIRDEIDKIVQEGIEKND